MRAEEISAVRADLAESEKRLDNRITGEISSLREEMFRRDLSVIEELKSDIAGFRTEMHVLHSRTIRWMFFFRIGQICAVLGILFALFK